MAEEGGPNLYSVSRMLDIVKSSSEASGVEVSVKKKMSDGAYIPVEEEDIEMADFDVKLKQVVEMLASKTADEKRDFSFAMRDAGNEAFYNHEYARALEMYAQAAAGLSAQQTDAKRDIILPILTNMAFCFLELRKPKLALGVCDEALLIDPLCAKAHYRRGKALVRLDRYAEAKAAFQQSGDTTDDPAPKRQIYDLAKTTRVVRRVKAARRHNLRNVFKGGAIYDDKADDPKEARLEKAKLLADTNPMLNFVLNKRGQQKKKSLVFTKEQLHPFVFALVFVATLYYVLID